MIRNGIDLDQLAALEQQLETVPEAGALSVRLRTRWDGGYGASTRAEELVVGGERSPRDHEVTGDLPQVFGGRDRGPGSGELLLAALGTCITQRLAELAAVRGIDLEGLEVVATGDLDVRGTEGIDGVRPGFQRIGIRVEVAASDDVGDLLGDAVRTSPVADSLSAGVTMVSDVRRSATTR